MIKKNSLLFASLFCLTACLYFLSSCDPKERPTEKNPKVIFSGTVVSTKNEPVANAEVEINGQIIQTLEKGEFKTEVDSADRYVINVRAEGFGLVSRIFMAGVENKKYTLTKASVDTFNPSGPIQMRDVLALTSCVGPVLKDINWSANPFRSVPLVINAAGQLVDFGFSTELQTAFQYFSAAPACSPGISISIQAGSLIGPNNQPPADSVTIALSTIDIFSEDGMPGDFTFRSKDNQQRGYMRSMGAGTIEVYSKDRKTKYNLKEGATATLTIPIDPGQLKLSKEIPKTISVLEYDEKEGIWIHDTEATLNQERNAYTAEVSHFSEFNMDIEKTDPACARFQVDAAYPTSYKVAAIDYDGTVSPTFPALVNEPGSPDCSPVNGKSIHMLYRLPNNNKTVCVILYDAASSPPEPIGIHIIETLNQYAAVPACPYIDCAGGPYLFEFFNKPALVAAKQTPGGNITIRWICNRDAASNFTYDLWKCDAAGVKTGASPILSKTAILTDDPRVPTDFKKEVSTLTTLGLSSGDHIKIFLTGAGIPGGEVGGNITII